MSVCILAPGLLEVWTQSLYSPPRRSLYPDRKEGARFRRLRLTVERSGFHRVTACRVILAPLVLRAMPSTFVVVTT